MIFWRLNLASLEEITKYSTAVYFSIVLVRVLCLILHIHTYMCVHIMAMQVMQAYVELQMILNQVLESLFMCRLHHFV